MPRLVPQPADIGPRLQSAPVVLLRDPLGEQLASYLLATLKALERLIEILSIQRDEPEVVPGFGVSRIEARQEQEYLLRLLCAAVVNTVGDPFLELGIH